MDYLFNFLQHLPNFFTPAFLRARKYGTGVAIKIFARYVAETRLGDILRVKQGKGRLTCAKAEWTGGCYTGGHLLADSRHSQWKWRTRNT